MVGRSGAGGEGPRVLVVEDDPIGQRVVVQLVERLGYPVDVVSGGQAAIDAVATTAYTLVLMDCQMPGIDGYAATAEIRRREAALGDQAGRRVRRVPIVALTASRLDSDQDRCLAAGMDEYLTKPIDSQRLAALIERWAPGHSGSDPSIGRTQGPEPAASPAAQTTEVPPILDPAGLLGSVAVLSLQHREIVDLFLEEVPRRLNVLTLAAARGDRDRVARLAHTLAGSADSLGAARLAAACAQLEALVRDQPSAGSRDHDSLTPARPLPDGLLADAIGTVHQELQQLQAALTSSTLQGSTGGEDGGETGAQHDTRTRLT
jgi:CheY-like chemotaxis protein